MIRALAAGLLLAGCGVTPQQWIAQCIADGHPSTACEAYMAEQIRLSTPVLICREVGDELVCYLDS